MRYRDKLPNDVAQIREAVGEVRKTVKMRGNYDSDTHVLVLCNAVDALAQLLEEVQGELPGRD